MTTILVFRLLLLSTLLISTTSTSFEFRRRRSSWPSQDTTACSQTTKQKSMYAEYTFSPSLQQKPAIDVSASVVWEDLVQAPWRTTQGGVYASWTFGTVSGPAGYMGAQILPQSGLFIFSIWDGNRWNGQGTSKEPKASDLLVWPLDLQNCNRNCQDCGLAHLQEWKKQGLTTGTKCLPQYPAMKDGGQFNIRLRRTQKQITINTQDYGGMPVAHASLGEIDRNVTGAEWEVTAEDVSRGTAISIGRLLFEGDGSGLERVKVFDEMLGCNHCNDMYHRETRYGPFLKDEDGTIRRPTAATRLHKGDSTCTKYAVTGNVSDSSVTFEGGPSAEPNFVSDNNYHPLWSGGEATVELTTIATTATFTTSAIARISTSTSSSTMDATTSAQSTNEATSTSITILELTSKTTSSSTITMDTTSTLVSTMEVTGMTSHSSTLGMESTSKPSPPIETTSTDRSALSGTTANSLSTSSVATSTTSPAIMESTTNRIRGFGTISTSALTLVSFVGHSPMQGPCSHWAFFLLTIILS